MWPEEPGFSEDYGFKSSPESNSDSSFLTDNLDNLDNVSDEDFMAQLSSSLDIPLLLNEGDDEMSVLNSFLDNSPDEILSDFTAAQKRFMNDELNMKDDLDFLNDDLPMLQNSPPKSDTELSGFTSNNSLKTVPNDGALSYFDYLNGSTVTEEVDIKSEDHSEESCSSSNSLEPSTPPPVVGTTKKINPVVFYQNNIVPKKEVDNVSTVQVVPQTPLKVPIKRVPIKPKVPYAVPTKTQNIVLINNIKGMSPQDTKIISPGNIRVLDSISLNGFKPIIPTLSPAVAHISKPVSIPTLSIKTEVDPKVLKRQERRIKNRESASISRKKKKDYLNSLEDQVKVLMAENMRLIEENASLKERLALYENNVKNPFKIAPKTTKPAVFLCVFLLVVGLNLNLSGNIFSTKPSSKLNPDSGDYPKLPAHYSRNLLWAEDDSSNRTDAFFSPLTMCPASINQTESARLLLELERWIGKPEVVMPPRNSPAKPTNQRLKTKRLSRKKLRLDSSLAQIRRRGERHGPENLKNEIQVFNPKPDQIYSEFYEAIKRRDDTFYVVSFSEQHMLLPALYHNNTRRPKMSLLMPSVYPNDTSTQTFIPLMQIDCEVLDTKLVNVKYGSIPRPHRQYANVTKQKADEGEPGGDNGTEYATKKAYKPYFLGKNLLKALDYN